MLSDIVPKLPMRNKQATLHFYINHLGFDLLNDYGDYVLLIKDRIELHFFLFKNLIPEENYGQVYIRTDDILTFHDFLVANNVQIHPGGSLEQKPWGQTEFSLLDPDHNLITFGQPV